MLTLFGKGRRNEREGNIKEGKDEVPNSREPNRIS